jgi:peptide-methionine (S)-S-oxide reductase
MDYIKLATLGAGCFWCIDTALRSIKGITNVTSGYTGGHVTEPTYQQICQGNSGHAEVVQVEFDQRIISYEQLLTFFFQLHDPTQLNRQGNDIGTQYRSVIYFHDAQQKAIAEQQIEALNQLKIWDTPIVTDVCEAQTFYPAEQYHQNYIVDNQEQPYCQFVIAPKLEMFKYKFKDYLKSN